MEQKYNHFVDKNSMKTLFWQTLSVIKSIALSETAHASPTRPSYKSGIEVKLSVEHR